MHLRLTINDQVHEMSAEPHRSLADVIRTDAALTGTKVACGEGTCGSCTVLVDDRAVLSCLTLAVACDGADVRTVEGGGDELLERLRRPSSPRTRSSAASARPASCSSAVALLERDATPDHGRDRSRR